MTKNQTPDDPLSLLEDDDAFGNLVEQIRAERVESGLDPDTGISRAETIRKHDFPALLAFHSKHALGSLQRPSCLVCGKVPEEWPPGIQHMELPDIIVCTRCRDGALKNSPDRGSSSRNEAFDLIDEALTSGLNWIQSYDSDVSGLSTSTEEAIALARHAHHKAIDALTTLRSGHEPTEKCLVAGCGKPCLVAPDGAVGGLCAEHNGKLGMAGDEPSGYSQEYADQMREALLKISLPVFVNSKPMLTDVDNMKVIRDGLNERIALAQAALLPTSAQRTTANAP